MSIQVDNIETCTRTAIGELLLKADSNQLVKRVFTAFDPIASKTAQIKALSSFKLEFLEATADFLDIELSDSDDNKIFTKDTLQSRILLGIKAYLPATCSECSHVYRNTFEAEEQPPLHCYMCFQGSHDCSALKDKVDAIRENNILLSTGTVWLCYDCHKNSNPIVPRKSKFRHNSTSSSVLATNSRAPSPQPVIEGQPAVEEVDRSTDICGQYKTGKCPHGLRGNKLISGSKCSMAHPKRCIKFCRNGKSGKFGCNKGINCTYYHPVLCKYSVQKRVCTNKECTFVHLKGTKRELIQISQGEAATRSTSEQGRVRTFSQRSHVTNAYDDKKSSNPKVNSDHFLELKNIVQLMNNNLVQQQQEISSLRSSVVQVHQFQMQFPSHPPPLTAQNNPMSHLYQPNLVQNHPIQHMVPPTMTFIPQSSC